MRRLAGPLVRLGLTALVASLIWFVAAASVSDTLNLTVIWAGPLAAYPFVSLGRVALDRRRSSAWTPWTIAGVQCGVALSLGAPLARAIRTQASWPGIVLPVPDVIGLVLVAVTSLAAMATVLNLALRGLGAPFFVQLSRRLASDWLYAWTRNPMVLASLCLLVSLGIWFQSLLFIAWSVVDVAPALLFFVRVFEERELELRFGDPYRDYRSRTPLLFPRRPRPSTRP